MKSIRFSRVAITSILFGGFVAVALAGLTATDVQNILFMKQEEKLARDVYQALYEKWGHTTFANIVVSEQRHMNAVDGLITRYKLTDETPTEYGKFTYPELQALYDALVARGNESMEEALAVGVEIENTDIADLQAAIAVTTEKPIKTVFSNLLSGSYNHLAAFTTALAALEQ